MEWNPLTGREASAKEVGCPCRSTALSAILNKHRKQLNKEVQ